MPARHYAKAACRNEPAEDPPLLLRRSDGVFGAVDEQTGIIYSRSAGAQILVDDEFIAAAHDGRKGAVFGAAEVTFGKARRKRFYRPVQLYLAPVRGGARLYDARTARYDEAVGNIFAGEQFERDARAERMSYNVRTHCGACGNKFFEPIGIVAHRPRTGERRRRAEPRKIGRNDAKTVRGEVLYLIVKAVL